MQWYQPEITGQDVGAIAAALDESVSAMRAHGLAVQRVISSAVQTDEAIFSVFAATSSVAVVRVRQRAGIPARRLTAVVEDRYGSSKT